MATSICRSAIPAAIFAARHADRNLARPVSTAGGINRCQQAEISSKAEHTPDALAEGVHALQLATADITSIDFQIIILPAVLHAEPLLWLVVIFLWICPALLQ